jgi:hypothetical protein
MGRDSSAGIATRYRLNDPGIESRGRRDCLKPSRPILGPIQPSIQWVRGLSLGVKWPGGGVDNPSLSSAEVKERIQLYLYSSFWAVVACSRVNFTFTFITDRLALFAHSVCTKPNFQGLLWDEFGGLGEDKLKNYFCWVNDLMKLLQFYF